MTVFLGIDQSYSGFALAFYDAEDGTAASIVGKHNARKRGTGIDRLQDIAVWLEGTLLNTRDSMGDPGHICMEGYAYGRVNGREQAGELGGQVKRVLWEIYPNPLGYPTIVTSNQLKKFATSKGNAEKSQVLKSVYKKWGFDAETDDEADAYTLARIAHALTLGPASRDKLLVYEKEVLAELKMHTEQIAA